MNTSVNAKYDRIPKPMVRGKNRLTSMECLYVIYSHHKMIVSGQEPADYDSAERYACGYPLPPFQRDFVWSEEQAISFIESAFKGIDIGYYAVHGWDYKNDNIKKFSGWLLDGQQRLTVIQNYWDDKLKVFGLYWSELTRIEQKIFLRVSFQSYETEIWNLEGIKEYYTALAFGGTPHSDTDRPL